MKITAIHNSASFVPLEFVGASDRSGGSNFAWMIQGEIADVIGKSSEEGFLLRSDIQIGSSTPTHVVKVNLFHPGDGREQQFLFQVVRDHEGRWIRINSMEEARAGQIRVDEAEQKQSKRPVPRKKPRTLNRRRAS